MQRNTKFLAGTALAVAVLGGGAGAALAAAGNEPESTNVVDPAPVAAVVEQPTETDDDDVTDDDADEQPITGTALDQAAAAALQQFPDGTVTDTEVGDEEGYYEVEVTLPDGSEVDVHLDESFAPIGNEHDGLDDEDDDD